VPLIEVNKVSIPLITDSIGKLIYNENRT